MYRVFDCTGTGGSDTIVAAMSKAEEDGVNLVSMSLGIGSEPFDGSCLSSSFIRPAPCSLMCAESVLIE